MTLSVVLTGDFLVTMRNNMINLLGEDYIAMGRAKGLADRRVMLMYGARNALLPGVTNLAIAIGKVLGGSLVTEVVFNYPGLGNTLYKAILARDYPVIQGQLLIMTLAMLTANFLADIAYVLLDPRLRGADHADDPGCPVQPQGRDRPRHRRRARRWLALIAPLLTDYNPSRRIGRPHETPSADPCARHHPQRPGRLRPAGLRRPHLAGRRLRRRAADHRRSAPRSASPPAISAARSTKRSTSPPMSCW